ncbi:hypothetical protein [Colwellia sp. Arc7-D]|uniref:hypothetical protein n=1 Tax=Colwellia sp. Arc7-D TaxID=2161872 RepID=UPI000D396B23|nr:hypothetical protein [Colwellia sp. Arc7-D]AWB56550.1 hypothetical protein DBO93_02530 [Colwellia sp. Arc7-D]
MLTSLNLMIRPAKLSNAYLGALFSLCFVFNLSAAEIKSEPLQIHGFVAQGVIDASHSNFINNDESLSFELTEIGLNASYQLNDDFRIAGQAVYLNGGNRYHPGLRLDYLLLEWDAFHNETWQASFYVGRVKNNHWLYSSTRDIPFARPSIINPQVTYFDGFRDVAVGGDGAAVKLSYSDDYLGEIDFNFSRGKSAISDDQADVIQGEFALGEIDHDLDMQASIYWRPAYSQWQFGVSAVDSSFIYKEAQVDNFHQGDFKFQFYTVNALYEGEFWQLSAELVQERQVSDGFYFTDFHRDEIGQGYYVQARYQVEKDLSVMLRHERFYVNKDDKNGSELAKNTGGVIPAYFGFHNDTMIGLSYDFSDNFRMNAEYHWMKGAARLSPVILPDPIANDSKNWQVWAIQFMYWF